MHTGATHSVGLPLPTTSASTRVFDALRGEGGGEGVTARSSETGARDFIIALDAAAAVDAECVGPKAANLAALTRAGLSTPGGFCLTADAYRAQIAALGLTDLVQRFAQADLVTQRR